ncbi:MAG: hypothetical protein AAB724_01930, partial [Patescibacteria group bacterium]
KPTIPAEKVWMPIAPKTPLPDIKPVSSGVEPPLNLPTALDVKSRLPEGLKPTIPQEKSGLLITPESPTALAPTYPQKALTDSFLAESGATRPEIDWRKVSLFVGATLGVIVIVGALAFWLITRSPAPPVVVSSTPSSLPSILPTVSVTPVATPPSLFVADKEKIIQLESRQKEAITRAIKRLAINLEPAGEFTQIFFKDEQNRFVTLEEILTILEVDFFVLPTQRCQGQSCGQAGQLSDSLDLEEYSFFVYSQAASSSSPFLGGKNSGRFGLMIGLKAAAGTSTPTIQISQGLKDLEPMIIDSLDFLLTEKAGQPTSPGFNDNNYQKINIRYVNLPSFDLSLDYAVTSQFLILATSKESMLAMVDRLKMKQAVNRFDE